MGALVSTFFLLEVFGTRRTILVAALLNVLVALIARSVSRKAPEVAPEVSAEPAPATGGERVPLVGVLVASGLVGFTFFLMEMTWYRMLGPILGGTVFTFGLILAVALFGIGLGGLAYALRPAAKAATVIGLAFPCLVEAIGLPVPWAPGDPIPFGAGAWRGGS